MEFVFCFARDFIFVYLVFLKCIDFHPLTKYASSSLIMKDVIENSLIWLD